MSPCFPALVQRVPGAAVSSHSTSPPPPRIPPTHSASGQLGKEQAGPDLGAPSSQGRLWWEGCGL